MYLPDFDLHDARTTEEAIGLLDRHAPDARLLAGGTDLLIDLRTRRYSAANVISLNRIAELRGIRKRGDSVHIGALTSITQVVNSTLLLERFPAIMDAASRMASHQIRNLATVGGNIACAAPCADLPPILITMNASIALRSKEVERIVPLETFFTGPRETIIEAGEILTDVILPKAPSGSGAAYSRFGLREGNSIAVAGVAAGILLGRDGGIVKARMALAAVAPTPKLVGAVEEHLRGGTPSAELFSEAAEIAAGEANPISDVRGSTGYRKELVRVLAKRALDRALERAKGVAS